MQIGIGTVGSAVVEQALEARKLWRQSLGLDISIASVIGRDGALVATDDALSDSVLREIIDNRRAGVRLSKQEHLADTEMIDPAEALRAVAARGSMIVLDAAAGERSAALDAEALRLGGGVVLSNKAPLALPVGSPCGQALWEEAGPTGRLRYEATCGAGLPVLSTLRGLLDTGDEIIEIDGTVSGTFGAIFSGVAAGALFSQAVRVARERGFTEPDPRDDLSGLDVARKALILARTLGRQIDLSEIKVETLVPDELHDVSVPQFLDQISMLDEEIGRRAAQAATAGEALRYVMSVTPDGPIEVGVRPVDKQTVLGALLGPENVISFRTRRYDAHPLNVTGPGAGADVTAAGMLTDMLALARGPLVG
ncbi:MAG TPA: hypothetical protein VFL82_17160 [Thermomicrobiales bacterium]|nr:hypothetical protein [Thermomicrobiales bacterium]